MSKKVNRKKPSINSVTRIVPSLGKEVLLLFIVLEILSPFHFHAKIEIGTIEHLQSTETVERKVNELSEIVKFLNDNSLFVD